MLEFHVLIVILLTHLDLHDILVVLVPYALDELDLSLLVAALPVLLLPV